MAEEKELLADLGRRVRVRRERMGLAQADLGTRGGPGETTVSRLERGDGAAPRRQTQEQLEKALALPPGTVRDFLDIRRRELANGPNRLPAPTPPLGGTTIQVLDLVLAQALQNALGYAAGVGATFDIADEDPVGALRALTVAGRTPPAFPMTLVHVTSGREYDADGPSDLNNMIGTGHYQLKHAIPGVNLKVYDPSEHARDVTLTDPVTTGARAGSTTDPPPQVLNPAGTPSTATVGVPTLTQQPPARPRSERTRVNPDGSVERSPMHPLRWRVVGHLGDEGTALASALDALRDMPPTDDVIRANHHLSRVLQELAEHIDEDQGAE